MPPHTFPAGMMCGRVSGELKNTDELLERLLGLPLWLGLESQQKKVITAINQLKLLKD